MMITGSAGTGKSSFAAQFVDEMCRNNKKCLYFSFEESPAQTIRNMKSIGMDLAKWQKNDLLQFSATRPSYHGLEMHLTKSIKLIESFKPAGVVIDPLTDLTSIGSTSEVKLMLARLIDYLKNNNITAVMTGLRSKDDIVGEDRTGISSLIDTWVLLEMAQSAGVRSRIISIVKSRGMPHSNKVREFKITDDGVKVLGIYSAELRSEQAKTEDTQYAREASPRNGKGARA